MKNIKLFLQILFLISLVQCKKEDKKESITIDQHEISLNSGDTRQLNIIYSNDDLRGKTYVWSSGNKNVATVSSSGLVTGIRVGVTHVSVSSNGGHLADSAKINLQARYNLYKEPYLVFGATVAVVKAYETRVLLGDESGLIYQGENSNVIGVMYLFSDNSMTGACVLLENTVEVGEILTYFLSERYEFIETSDDIFFFSNNNGIIAAMSIQETLGLNVIYMEDLKSTQMPVELYKKTMEHFKSYRLLR